MVYLGLFFSQRVVSNIIQETILKQASKQITSFEVVKYIIIHVVTDINLLSNIYDILDRIILRDHI